VLKAWLGRHGIRAEKGLGQHFLVSGPVVASIVDALAECRGLLEIGPGPGVLTSPLACQAERIVAVELDDRMVAILSESAPSAHVRKEDALKADLRALLDDLPEPRGVVSNLPYYITGPLLERIADVRDLFDRAVLMMQKEVAERIRAKAGGSERGALSVMLQSQFEISRLASAPAGAFLPPPKVDSEVLLFRPRRPDMSPEAARMFERTVRLGFAQRRKTLLNNLVAGFHLSRDEANEVLEAAGISPLARPQELSEGEWKAVAQAPGLQSK